MTIALGKATKKNHWACNIIEQRQIRIINITFGSTYILLFRKTITLLCRSTFKQNSNFAARFRMIEF